MSRPVSRRGIIATTSTLALLPVLSSCGEDDAQEVSAPEPLDTGTELLSTDDVPVGGCRVLDVQKVVVTQPTEGEFKAFSAVCTHAGCLVSSSSDGEIPCKCHGSRFALTDGAVLGGQAKSALPAVEIEVVDGVVRAV